MRYLTLLLLALSPSLAFAQPKAVVPDPDPELERKTFTVAPGFEVTLWAADPLLAKPIQMNWDPQGRLWIASSEHYPQIKPGEKANDKIIVLEDTKGAGKADKTTVFADGLLIPTGLEPGDGGVYVANSTELVHLSASKPGQKADKKRVLLSGFGTEDTHHIIHTFRWGPDCRLYFNQSIYIHSHVETPTGVKRLNAGGIWRFNPDKTELDIFARGWVNSWGHAFDKYGQSLATDGAGGEGINHVVPGGYYLTSQGPHAQRVLHGLNPGSPKYCGLEVISGRHFPDDWQGDLITNDFRGHRVCRFKLKDDGSTFASREMTEVIKSNHPAFRPIDVKMGPDGALYIADWYNPIIQHGEVDFRDPRRDKTHGRIWRVTAKGRDLVKPPKLVDSTIPELLDALKAPEQWTRQMAKRVLKERGAEKVLPELKKWVRAQDHKAANYQHWMVEGLWLLQALGGEPTKNGDPSQLSDELINGTFDMHDPKVPATTAPLARANAVRALVDWRWIEPDQTIGFFSEAVKHAHPRLRLEGVRALAATRSSKSVELALDALDKPMDRTLDYALWLTVRELEPYWLPEFQAGKLTFGGDAKKLAFALNAIGNKETAKPVYALIQSGKLPKENLIGMWLLLAQVGDSEHIGKMLAFARADKALTEPERARLLVGMEDAVRVRRVFPPDKFDLKPLEEFMASDNDAARRAAIRLAGFWRIEALRAKIEAVAVPEKATPVEDRLAAFDALISMAGRSKEFVQHACGANQPEATRRLALATLAAMDTPVAAKEAAKYLPTAKADEGLADLFTAFVTRKYGNVSLSEALAGTKLPKDVAKIGLQAIRASGQPATELAAALTKAGDLGAPPKPPTADEVKALAADAMKTGNAARGELVYRRKELQCIACHAYAGAGGRVGPDMTSIGASAQPDYLVDSLLLPHKQIKEGFDVTRVVTASERVVQGIKVSEANGMITLRTAEDKDVILRTTELAERGKSTKSLMPEGLTESLTKQEFADLVKFLSELGKVGGDYAPSKARLVRRWEVIDPTPANLNLFRRTRVSAAAEPDNPFTWSPAYGKVSADLPLADLPKFTVWNDTAAQSVVRFQLDVTAAGAAKLKFNAVAGLTVYVGNTPIEVKPETVLDLKAGVQTVTVLIDRSKRTEDVRVELDDVDKSPARVAVVGGK